MSARGIVKKDPADFTPTLGNYTDLQPFRFWCQKVLPLVYDDSLSYYELLCKVVDYLNKTMEDVGVLEGDVTGLHEAYKKLQSYVNDYFSTLDVQEEINNKLDAMAKNGTLSQLIKPYVQESPTFVDSENEMTNANSVYVLKTNGHLYTYNRTTNNFEDSGLAYGINGIYPKNVDYNTWINTIMNKQVFKDKQALFVTNPYKEAIVNNSYECKSELVSHNCEFTETNPILIYGLTTPITNLEYFFRHYSVLLYSNISNVKIRMYALTKDRQLGNSYSSVDITLDAGMNLIRFTQTHGTVDTIESIGVLLLSTNNVKTVDIDKMYFTVIKDYYVTRVDYNHTLYPANIDYSSWGNTIMNKQVFKDKQALFVTNPYKEAIVNNSYECKSELVSHNCEFTETNPILIYGLTTPITNLEYFFRHYSVLLYSNISNVKIRMYALTKDRQLGNSYSSVDITLDAGMNLIRFTQTHGTVDTIESIGVLLLSTNNVKTVDIDKMYFTVIKDYYEKKEKHVNNLAFIGDSLTQQDYMAYFYYNQFTYKAYAVGGEDIPKIFARTNIDSLYANNTGVIDNGTILDLNVKNMFKQGYGNINPVKVGESTFDIILENNSYVVKNISKPFTYHGEYIISNTAQEKFDFYVIWCGTNSVTSMTKEEIIENWEKALTVYPNSIIIGLTCDRFTSVENLKSIDALAKSKLGNRYLPIHDIIVKYGLEYNKLTPTATDNADIKENKIPTQLLKDDGLLVHFNQYGQKYVAHIIQEFLKTYHIY